MTATRQPRITIEFEYPYRPATASTFHLVTTITAPALDESERRERPPLNLSFIVDRSGSMSGGKFDLACQGVEYAVGLLDRRDTLSLVVYDSEIDLLLSQRKANGEACAKATRRLRRIRPRGSTALAGGWATGCAQLAPLADEDPRAICRSILLTDGLANVGETDPAVLARDAGVLAARGITTTTFGVGQRFDEVLLAGMADAGQGRYHYIADHAGIVPVFAGELGELLEVTMRAVHLSLGLPEGWRARCLNDLPLTTSGPQVSVGLGDIASGAERVVVWEITAPTARAGARDSIEVALHWRTADGAPARSEPVSRTVEAREDTGPADPAVQDRLAATLSARAQAEALEHNRAGRYDQAAGLIREAGATMPQSAEGSRQTAALASLSGLIAAPLSGADSKDWHSRSRRTLRTERDYSSTE